MSQKKDKDVKDVIDISERKDLSSLFKKPKFTVEEKFIDDVIRDPESFGVLHSAIDVLVQMRSKLPNQYVSYIQIYASLLKTLYIYEAMIKSVHRMTDPQFKYMSELVIKNCKKTVKNIDFKSIEKKIASNKAKLRNVKKTDEGLSYIISEGDTSEFEHKETRKKSDYIG